MAAGQGQKRSVSTLSSRGNRTVKRMSGPNAAFDLGNREKEGLGPTWQYSGPTFGLVLRESLLVQPQGTIYGGSHEPGLAACQESISPVIYLRSLIFPYPHPQDGW